jgi:glycine/D-amino acid oxidase-like deaminating enzyme
MPTQNHLIIGFGVYGISTALHLGPSARLTVVSYRQACEPSNDIAKIVRVDYDSVQRMEEAIYAQNLWREDARFTPFYRPCGRLVAYDKTTIATLDGIDKARSQLGLNRRQRSNCTLLQKYYGSTNTVDDLTYVFNEDDALVDWEGCMQAMEKRCREGGSEILDTRVDKLIHNKRRITSVALSDGKMIKTGDTKVILAAGPWIAQLLDNSNIEQPPDRRMPTATGLFSFRIQLSEDQKKLFQGKPSFSHIGRGKLLRSLLYS